MHPHDASESIPSIPARSDAVAPNPIHVVGAIAAKELAAARLEALRAFHLSLDEADRNLLSLLPRKRRTAPDRPSNRFTVTDESPAFSHAQAGPARPVGPVGAVPSAAFELWAPWYVDAADQPA